MSACLLVTRFCFDLGWRGFQSFLDFVVFIGFWVPWILVFAGVLCFAGFWGVTLSLLMLGATMLVVALILGFAGVGVIRILGVLCFYLLFVVHSLWAICFVYVVLLIWLVLYFDVLCNGLLARVSVSGLRGVWIY